MSTRGAFLNVSIRFVRRLVCHVAVHKQWQVGFVVDEELGPAGQH
jgi:hypothetical protein